jgi:hypothetical protein
LKESAGEVTVSTSLKDDFAYSAAPKRFRSGSTGIEATTYVTLKAIVESESTSVSPDAIERWSKWALAQADRIDPVRSTRFLRGIDADDDAE